MLKDILEILGVVVALILSVIAVLKYWSAAKTAKEFSADIGKLYDQIREVEHKMQNTIATCQANHADFDKEVSRHLRDKATHRDAELETFRYDTLAKAISELKGDFSSLIGKIETALCERISALERTVRNGGGR